MGTKKHLEVSSGLLGKNEACHRRLPRPNLIGRWWIDVYKGRELNAVFLGGKKNVIHEARQKNIRQDTE